MLIQEKEIQYLPAQKCLAIRKGFRMIGTLGFSKHAGLANFAELYTASCQMMTEVKIIMKSIECHELQC